MSVQISIDVGNLSALAEDLANLIENLPSAIGTALMNVGEKMLMTSQALVPVRTGYLKSTLALEQVSNYQIRLKATAGYALYVEFGTKRMGARLFLTRAIQQNLPTLPAEVQTQILNLVEEYLSE